MVEKDRTCKYCNILFPNIEGRVFSNHVRWCDNNPKSKCTENIAKAHINYINNKLGKLTEFFVNCIQCNTKFAVVERELKFPSRTKYFCSIRCSKKRDRPQEVRDKISKKLSKKSFQKICKFCNSNFSSKKEKQVYCSKQCVYKEKRQNNQNQIRSYRVQCNFDFSIRSFPEEFDFQLISKFGWYSPSNKKNNLTGVSRDHIISVQYGFKNNIDPEIIKHPANCQLLVHNENLSKGPCCGMTLEELKQKIIWWDQKYKS